MTFQQPQAAGDNGDNFDPKDHIGKLILLFPTSFTPQMQTTKGPSDALDADIIVVDQFGPDGKPLIYRRARLFGNLATKAQGAVGGVQLARLNQITQPSGRTPWIWENHTDADAALAVPVHDAYKRGEFAQPVQQQAPPSHDPWAGVNASPAPPPGGQQWGQQQPPAAPAPQQQGWGQQPPPPPQPQGGGWGAPPPTAPAPQAAPAPSAGVDPALVDFLTARGIPNAGAMNPSQALMIAQTYGWQG